MTRQIYLSAALLLLLTLAGCGQNGPLYIPGNPSEMKLPPQAPQEQVDEQDEDEDEDETRDDTDNGS